MRQGQRLRRLDRAPVRGLGARQAALDPALRAQLGDLGRRLPELWASGRLRPEQQKEVLRSLIRRVILARPVPDEVHIKIVWISGAVSPLVIHPRLLRSVTLSTYPRFVERVLALAAEGYLDADIAQTLTDEGFRSARSPSVPLKLVFRVRRQHGQASLVAPRPRSVTTGRCGACRASWAWIGTGSTGASTRGVWRRSAIPRRGTI